MKSALSLTLIVCLVGSAVPVAAQDRLDSQLRARLAEPSPGTPFGLPPARKERPTETGRACAHLNRAPKSG